MPRRNSGAGLINLLIRFLTELISALFRQSPAAKPPGQHATRARTATPVSGAASLPTHRWPELGDFEFPLVGESFYQDALQAVADVLRERNERHFEVTLRLENDNPHDNKAVGAYVARQKIGHLSRQDARSYRRRLSALKLGQCDAICMGQLIGGHTLKDGSTANIGVLIDIKPFG